MSPAVNVDLEEVPFAILEAVKARILANRARINDARLRPSTRPRPQFRKTGASSSSWKLPQHGAAAVDDGVALWQVRETQPTDDPYSGWHGLQFTAASDFTIRFVGRAENLAAASPSSLPIAVFRQLTAPESGIWTHELLLETQFNQRATQWYAGGFRYTEIEPIQVVKGDAFAVMARWDMLSTNPNDIYQMYQFAALDPGAVFDYDDPRNSIAIASQDLLSDCYYASNLDPTSDGRPTSGQIYGALWRMTTSFAIDDVDNAKPDWAYIGAPTPVGGRTLPWTGP